MHAVIFLKLKMAFLFSLSFLVIYYFKQHCISNNYKSFIYSSQLLLYVPHYMYATPTFIIEMFHLVAYVH